MDDQELFLLYSRKHSNPDIAMWWRPDASGYTISVKEAGRYTQDEAIKHSDFSDTFPIRLSTVRDITVVVTKGSAENALLFGHITHGKLTGVI